MLNISDRDWGMMVGSSQRKRRAAASAVADDMCSRVLLRLGHKKLGFPVIEQAQLQPRIVYSAHMHTLPLPVLEQLRGSHLAESLVSRGAASRGAACEVSHESNSSAMPCVPNLAAIAHTLPQHMPPQVSNAVPVAYRSHRALRIWLWPRLLHSLVILQQ